MTWPMSKSRFLLLLSFMVCMGFYHVAYSGSFYEWVDEEGNVTYQDTPPPAGVNYEEQEFRETEPALALDRGVSESLNAAVKANPISFYSIVDCDTCDLIRLYLEKISVPYSEKDVQDDILMQQELKEKTGRLQVPAIVIGDLVIDGYSKTAIRNGLIDNGYPVEAIESGADVSGNEETEVEGLANE